MFSPKGQLILKRHQAVSAFDIAKFGFYNIASVYVEGSSAQEKEELNEKYAIIKEKYRDSIDNLSKISTESLMSVFLSGMISSCIDMSFIYSCRLSMESRYFSLMMAYFLFDSFFFLC